MSPVRRGHSELSVGRPSLGCMTAMAQDSAQGSTANMDPVIEVVPDDAPEAPRRPSLSPSRAADFKTCPLLYRFRTIDRLPERKSLAAVRGTLVHSVLEKLYDLPAPSARSPAPSTSWSPPGSSSARSRASPTCRHRSGRRRGTTGRRGVRRGVAGLGGEAVERYFTLEDPRASSRTAARSSWRSLPDGLLLRGYVDRLESRRTGRCASSTTRPARCRARRSRPRRCSR